MAASSHLERILKFEFFVSSGGTGRAAITRDEILDRVWGYGRLQAHAESSINSRNAQDLAGVE